MAREHWWNVDFDLALQPGWRPDDDPNLRAQIRQLELHALLAGKPEDTILVADPPPEIFLEYLRSRGLDTPLISVMPSVRSGSRFAPYGWSPQAIALRGRYDNPEPHPKLEVVRRVNGRRFSHDIEKELLGSRAPLGSFTSTDELERLLDSEPECPHGWVVKTEHGNAALGNRRLRTASITAEDRRWVESRQDRGPMVLERWQPRDLDLSVVFEVTDDGEAAGLSVHETVHTSDGGVIGAVFSEDRADLDRWRDQLEDAATTVARALCDAGYFGPVCMDALVWMDGGPQHLRPLVDINARRHAGEGWSRLAREWGGCVYGRFYSARRLRLPDAYDGLEHAVGADAWDPRSRTGVLLTSPLWLDTPTGPKRPLKLGVLFRAPTRTKALAMDARFRARFER